MLHREGSGTSRASRRPLWVPARRPTYRVPSTSHWRVYAVTIREYSEFGYWSFGGRFRLQGLPCTVLALAAGPLSGVAQGDNFANVYYDARKDQLVVTLFYRGTNPDHSFSLQWGTCKDSADGTTREIAA